MKTHATEEMAEKGTEKAPKKTDSKKEEDEGFTPHWLAVAQVIVLASIITIVLDLYFIIKVTVDIGRSFFILL
jgi:hypothetical protein